MKSLTATEVEQIVDRKLSFYNEVIGYFQSEKNTMSTMEVARFFKVGRDWVVNRKNELGGKRKANSRRGDLVFNTSEIVEYKRKHF